jgi:hypothetical protein
MRLSVLLRYLHSQASALAADERGAAFIFIGLMVPVLMGATGLSVDLGRVYAARVEVQTQADAAAVAAALEITDGRSEEQARTAATESATANGYDDARGDDLEVHMPPESGAFSADDKAAEAFVRQRIDLIFAPLVGSLDGMTVEGRAIARRIRPEACVWALETNATGLELSGTPEVDLNCGVYVRSTNARAMDVNGSACIAATSIVVQGNYSGTCGSPVPWTSGPDLEDPLGSLPQPSAGGTCTRTSRVHVTGGTTTLSPGKYCGGIQISGGTVTFEPGLYVIAGREFRASGNSTLEGSGVTFFLTSGSGGYATLDLTSTVIDLTAPTSGAYKGLLFFQDRETPDDTANQLAGTATLRLQGVIYMPTVELSFAGGSNASAPAALLIARKIRFVGNSVLRVASDELSLPSGLAKVALVE